MPIYGRVNVWTIGPWIRPTNHRLVSLAFIWGWFAFGLLGWCADTVVPHNQDRLPNAPRSAQEAIGFMQVPPGFEVQLFAAEPDLVNPVAMTFDARGRVWVTESLEYPRFHAGVGQDRIKILEDTDQDGRADKVTLFAEDLNIPSGIALGYGGAFVANAPDLLFLQDTDGDGKADQRRVLLSGFGRADTHELPSALMWGPDGWLYGLNGVFNGSHIQHQGKSYHFTCALWRYHPITAKFELFAEGTSNPWGLDYDEHGEFFVSACVIDHLWHLTETGYYHRQAGPYPPFTWKLESIVSHKHQKAAYCGLCVYDADVYPQAYRGTLLMGNIHGNCINNDALEVIDASYRGQGRPDFLTANDAWFMPVVQKVGPDGCVWIADWYDQYHCYQDARRDPGGIDRLKGRIYRVTYQKTPMAKPFDLYQATTETLIQTLAHPNSFYRRWARQILTERQDGQTELSVLALDQATPAMTRREAFWTLASQGAIAEPTLLQLLQTEDPTLRAWAVRTSATQGTDSDAVLQQLTTLAQDPEPKVRLQVAIAFHKLRPENPLAYFQSVLLAEPADTTGVTERILWNLLKQRLPAQTDAWLAGLAERQALEHPVVIAMMPRLLELILTYESDTAADTVSRALLSSTRLFLQNAAQTWSRPLLLHLLDRLINQELSGTRQKLLLQAVAPELHHLAQHTEPEIQMMGQMWLGLAGEPAALNQLQTLASTTASTEQQIRCLGILLQHASTQDFAIEQAVNQLQQAKQPAAVDGLLQLLGRSRADAVATRLLVSFSEYPQTVAALVVETLSRRPNWARQLVQAVSEKRLASSWVNANQLRRFLDFQDAALTQAVETIWGKVRRERNTNREQVVAEAHQVLRQGKGDAAAGQKVYERVCAQCHQMHGQGHNVGPDLTRNGRDNRDQLVSNIFDPNLVIGKDYQARLLATVDGEVLTGLLVEDSPQRVILRLAGGKERIIRREDIEEMQTSPVSLMPEELEKQMSPQDIRDLLEYLLTAP